MNTGDYKTALSFFLKFQHSKQARGFIVNCYDALDDPEKASFFSKKLEF
jgi:hypothetical protein